jgi:hypothetical protein
MDVGLPRCKDCGSDEGWEMECRLQILLYGSSKDEAGPFARETPLDSLHEPLFSCDGCGEDADEDTATTLEAIYRGHSWDRESHPAQGLLLAEFGLDPDDRSLTPVSPITRFPKNTGLTDSKGRPW